MSLCLVLAGCGGGTAPISVAVTASANTVDGADVVTLTATVANDQDSKGVTWSVSGGGSLSNTTTTSATFTAPAATSSAQTITVTATSVANSSETANLTLTVAAKPAITTAGTALASQVGAAYNVTLQVSGGVSPYTWTLTSGTLPSCLTLNSSTGAITGSVTAACAGAYSPTFTVTDSGSPTKLTANEQVNFTITAAPAITLPASVPTATAGVAYSASVAATGGVSPLKYAITGGALPAGLTLNTSTGAISGTATTASPAGAFTVTASDNFGDTPASQLYMLPVSAGAATHFTVAATSATSITAGGTVSFQVTALDVDGNIAAGYAGTVHFTSSDSQAVLPGNATLTGGTGSFSATLKTAGSQTITATDASIGSIAGSLGGITVSGGTATKLGVSAPSTATSGTAINVTVTAQDSYGNTATNYAGTVAITSSDASALKPASSTLSSGTKVFQVILETAGSSTVTASDGTLSGTSGAITVSAGAASKLVVSAPTTATAGGAISVSVTAQDLFGNTATGYAGTVHFTSTDSAAALPAASTLTNGTGTFSATLKTAGSQTITATDTVTGTITGTTSAIAVSPAATAKLVVATASTATAGTTLPLTVTAEDSFGNTITSYSGTVHFTSTDSNAVLPANTALANGVGAFSVTLKTAGAETITATDTVTGSLTGTSSTITVSAATASSLTVAGPSTATAGTAFNVTITAKDAYGNTATAYTGTVGFTSSDSQAVLPTPAALISGVGTFPVTLKTTGAQTVTATDTVNPSITGSSAETVSAATANHYAVALTSGASITAGGTVSFTVTALDGYGNVATGYAGTVHLTSTDSAATLPGNSTLTNGTLSFTATLKTAGTQTITATDAANGTITGVSGSITVSAGAASRLMVSAPANATDNVAFNFTVTAQDSYGNTVTSFADTVMFTTSDGAATAPANSTLTNGTKTISITLKTNGAQTVTATDTSNGSITGTSGSINVSTALIVATTTLPAGDASASYSQTLAASGGSGTGFTWTTTSSNLSTYGLTISSAGVVSGTPTQSGTASFTAKVTDSANNTATQALSITVYSALSLPASNSLPQGYTNVAYTGTVAGSGGSGSLSISITSAFSPSNGTLGESLNGATVSFSGTPTNVTTESIGLKLTDTTTSNSISQTYSFNVVTPTAPSLPAANPVSLSSATVSQSYTGSITATGGVGPNYVWTVNGSTLATNGSPTSIGNGLVVTNTGNSVLQVSGSPTTVQNSPSLTFTAQIKDTTTGLSSGSVVYSIAVNPNGGTISGTVSLPNICGGLPQPTFQVSINTSPAQSVQTDSSGNFSFTGIPAGTYTLTPSLYNAPGGTETLFSPASVANLAVTFGSNLTENFYAAVGYTVSGNISYSGSQAGQVYIYLNNNNCGGNGNPGTSITESTLTSGGGAYTIRGVPPGSYTAEAWMDSTGVTSGPGAQGSPNVNDPTGSNNSVAVSGSVTNANVTLTNPSYATPSTLQFNAIPLNAGALLLYNPPTTNNVEAANEYKVQWAVASQTDSDGAYCALSSGAGSSFATVAGSHTFYAVGAGGATVWILNNTSMGAGSFTGGQTYCFQAQAVNTLASTTGSAWWTPTDSDSNSQGYTLTTPPCNGACTTVNGTLTIPAGVTIASGAPLYAGFFEQVGNNQGPSALYVQEISNPVVGANTFSVTLPNSVAGSSYVELGILDQNKDGQIDAGDVTTTRNNNYSGIEFTGGSTSASATLPSANSAAAVRTTYSSGNNGGYNVNLELTQQNKLPVAVTLSSGPNLLTPVDLGMCGSCGGSGGALQYSSNFLNGATANVGDQYDFTVTYSDGSQDTGSTVSGIVTPFGDTGTVAGVSDTVTNMSPSTTSSTLQPNFTWTFPADQVANPNNYFYEFQLQDCSSNCNTVWQLPGQNANSSGLSYGETNTGGNAGSILWNVDPTGNGSGPSVTNLTSGDQYQWSITVQDPNGNQAESQVNFTAQ